MHLPWLKKVGQVAEKIVDIGAAIDPAHFGVVALVAHLVENAFGAGTGPQKATAFMAALEPLIALLPADKQPAARAALVDARDSYVAFKNAEGALATAIATVETVIADVKAVV